MTAALNVNDLAVIGGFVRLPRRGAWVARLDLEGTKAPEGVVRISNFDETLALTGRVVRAAVFADSVQVLLTAGGGDLDTPVEAKAYRNVSARLVLQDIVSAAGEEFAASSSSAVLNRQLPHWVRSEGSAGDALEAVLRTLEATWRFLPDGTLWVGDGEAWPAAPTTQHTVLDEDSARGRALLAVETPRLLPATTFEGRRISLVIHEVAGSGITTELWFEEETDDQVDAAIPRLMGPLRRVLARVFARVDYLAPYRCRVVAQNADGTLELRPDATKLPALSRVPIKTGVPGVKVKVAPGAVCYVIFDGGDPSRPVAHGWEHDGMTELQWGGLAPMARQGDLVTSIFPPGFSFTATIAGLISTAPSTPISPGPAVVTVVAAPLPLNGIVVTGSGKMKA